jgi:cyclic dehypoxanthinyl futalosine synthase
MRKHFHPGGIVSFVVDRNINYTNVCINRCGFCAFWRKAEDHEAYVITRKALYKKIEETLELGGTQILIQGGLNPDLGMEYYLDLLKSIKKRFRMDIHGFSPPEICYLADESDLTIRETLWLLMDAGLDSIPGGGAEILADRVRRKLSPKKIDAGRWLKVMKEAHVLGMRTTATMMFGSIERPEDIIEHLDSLRGLQDKTGGFTAFIPWSFQPGNTKYKDSIAPATAVEYLRILAVSRIYLDNFHNVQASWVTQGIKLAQVALRFGANDLGSTMIEENVVASAGVSYRVSMQEMISAIESAGFKAAQRDTCYNVIKSY